MKETTIYVQAHTGEVVRIKVPRGTLTSRNDFDVENNGKFSQKVLKGYYELECKHGSRFPSNYKKNQIKYAHETALARGEG